MKTLFELAQADERITLIVGDLGFGVVTPFMERLPKQFVNAGVAEQNMTGLAVGMALSGKIVFTYSIANFPTLRCLEQVRNDVCYHNANVKIVAVGGGMAYGSLGISHHTTEDIAIMRALPNMVVVAPGDPAEARMVTRAVADWDGPCYLRLGRDGEPAVHSCEPELRLGRAIRVRDGSDLTLIVTGSLLSEAVAAADMLAGRGIHARVLSMSTIKPLDTEAVLKAARETSTIITVEEHSVIGGLGGAVAEVLMESDVRPVAFKRIGLNDTFSSKVGDQGYLRAEYGLDAAGILRTVESLLGSDVAAHVEPRKSGPTSTRPATV
ncbi:MAG TPA: transketolase C-terminal domain-containing protein [Methylomirabilota bacterium]|nr:transketolase C-terminal domain-containing protein [Methylomirabilota bacterium]